MLGEIIDRALTYGTPLFLLAKELLGKIAKDPKLQAKAAEVLIKLTHDGRTRSDELSFVVSLVKLPGVLAHDKQLFLQKHYELLHPDLVGKTPEQIKKLREKEKFAKGLFFLIAEDVSINNENPLKRFQLSKDAWYGIFLGIDSSLDDNAKLQTFEERILHFGKNHQERMSIPEIWEKTRPILENGWGGIDSGAQYLGNVINSATNWANNQYAERTIRADQRAQRRQENPLNWLNPRLWFRWFLDLR